MTSSGLVVRFSSYSANRGGGFGSCWSVRDSRHHKEEIVEERGDEGVKESKSISSSSSIGGGDSGDQRIEEVRGREIANTRRPVGGVCCKMSWEG